MESRTNRKNVCFVRDRIIFGIITASGKLSQWHAVNSAQAQTLDPANAGRSLMNACTVKIGDHFCCCRGGLLPESIFQMTSMHVMNKHIVGFLCDEL